MAIKLCLTFKTDNKLNISYFRKLAPGFETLSDQTFTCTINNRTNALYKGINYYYNSVLF